MGGKAKSFDETEHVKFADLRVAGSARRRNSEQEIELLSQFDHPNIPKIYGASRDYSSRKVAIRMQKADGDDLLKSFNEKGLELSLGQVARTMSELTRTANILAPNEQGIVHRDIKRENIIYDPNGRVFLSIWTCRRLRYNKVLDPRDKAPTNTSP